MWTYLEYNLITQEEYSRLLEISAEHRYEFGCEDEYLDRMDSVGVFKSDWTLLHRLMDDSNVLAVVDEGKR